MTQSSATCEGQPPRHSTLLALVQRLTHDIDSDEEVARTARRMIERGQVSLTGNFRGCPQAFGELG